MTAIFACPSSCCSLVFLHLLFPFYTFYRFPPGFVISLLIHTAAHIHVDWRTTRHVNNIFYDFWPFWLSSFSPSHLFPFQLPTILHYTEFLYILYILYFHEWLCHTEVVIRILLLLNYFPALYRTHFLFPILARILSQPYGLHYFFRFLSHSSLFKGTYSLKTHSMFSVFLFFSYVHFRLTFPTNRHVLSWPISFLKSNFLIKS